MKWTRLRHGMTQRQNKHQTIKKDKINGAGKNNKVGNVRKKYNFSNLSIYLAKLARTLKELLHKY
jgi:hypothetical protein